MTGLLNFRGTIDGPLKGPILRLERANEHIRELEPLIEAVTEPDCTTVIEEMNADGIHKTLKLRLGKRLSDRVFILAGDACGSMRSSLDQLIVALGRQANDVHGARIDTDKLYFPIARSLESFENSLKEREIAKLDADVIEVIKSFKPYKGPNDSLWSLNKLRTKDFHNDLIGISADVLPSIMASDLPPPNWRATNISPNIRPNVRFGGFPWDSVNNGMDLAIVGKDANIKDKISVPINVVFREPETLDGLPVYETLQGFSSLVERMLLTFRDRFFA